MIDVVCRGVPSPLILKRYVEWYGKNDQISDIKFRDKHYGYFSSTMSIYKQNGDAKRGGLKEDSMLAFFFNDLCSRPSCYDCLFKTKGRVTDFTMFDCWHAVKFSPKMRSNGATAVLVRTKKGEDIFSEIREKLWIADAAPDELITLDGLMMCNSVKQNEKRTEFLQKVSEVDFIELCELYNHKTVLQTLKSLVKRWMQQTGLFELYMKYKIESG